MDNFPMFVQKSHIYGKAHKETVNAVAGQNMQRTAHGQGLCPHQSFEALDKASGLGDFLCHNTVACFVDGA